MCQSVDFPPSLVQRHAISMQFSLLLLGRAQVGSCYAQVKLSRRKRALNCPVSTDQGVWLPVTPTLVDTLIKSWIQFYPGCF